MRGLAGSSGIKKVSISIVLIWLMTGVSLYAQSNYQEGYIITQRGDTLHGQINNLDWLENPDNISFRASPASEEQIFTALDLKAFFVSGDLYKVAVVTVDETPFEIQTTTHRGEITRSTRRDTVFLSVLIQGEVSLYSLNHERKNFYLHIFSEITELISHEYKVYRAGRYFTVKEEAKKYHDQLLEYAGYCGIAEVEKIKYTEKALMNFVSECNINRGASTSYVREIEKPAFGAKALIGVSHTNFDYSLRDQTAPFTSATNFTFGLTAILTLPRDRGRRSLFAGFQIHNLTSYNTTTYQAGRGAITLSEMVLDVTKLKLNVGFNYEFHASAYSPFVSFGGSINRQIFNKNAANIDIYVHKTENNTTELVHYSSTREEFTTYSNWVLGGFVDLGLKYNQFSISGRYERSYLSKQSSAFRTFFLLAGYELPF